MAVLDSTGGYNRALAVDSCEDLSGEEQVCGQMVWSKSKSYQNTSTSETGGVKCCFCEKRFPQESEQLQHVMHHAGTHGLRCNACPTIFSMALPNILYIHGKVHNIKKSKSKVNASPKHSVGITSLKDEGQSQKKRHYSVNESSLLPKWSNSAVTSNSTAKPLSDECDNVEKLCRENSFRVHSKKTSSSKNDGYVQCKFCNMTMPSNMLEDHTISQHMEMDLYKCSFCGKSFKSKSSIIYHLRSWHTGYKPYKCSLCEKGFPLLATLKSHLARHANEKAYKCNVCDKTFSVLCDMKRHREIHSTVKRFQCTICGAYLRGKRGLAQHLRRLHNKEKRFQCKVCQRTFRLQGDLTKHMTVHMMEKPFKCQTCGKHFKGKRYLQIHKRMKHMGKKPYKCNMCSKAFYTGSQLSVHKAIHIAAHKDKECYQCLICSKSFHFVSILKKHRQRCKK